MTEPSGSRPRRSSRRHDGTADLPVRRGAGRVHRRQSGNRQRRAESDRGGRGGVAADHGSARFQIHDTVVAAFEAARLSAPRGGCGEPGRRRSAGCSKTPQRRAVGSGACAAGGGDNAGRRRPDRRAAGERSRSARSLRRSQSASLVPFVTVISLTRAPAGWGRMKAFSVATSAAFSVPAVALSNIRSRT